MDRLDGDAASAAVNAAVWLLLYCVRVRQTKKSCLGPVLSCLLSSALPALCPAFSSPSFAPTTRYGEYAHRYGRMQ